MKRIELNLNIFLIVFTLVLQNSASFCFAQEHIWNEKRSLPEVRWGHSSCELDGKVYILGGMKSFNLSGEIPHKTVWMYDPVIDTCITKASMNIERAAFSTCAFDGKIYAIGGAQRMFTNTLALNSIEVYDPEQNSWTQLTDMPVARLSLTASIVDGKLYIIGGSDPNWQPIGQVDIYDIGTDTWTIGTPMSTPRGSLCAEVLNGKIFTIGGHRGSITNESGEKTVEVYDPTSDTWTSAADMVTKVKMMSSFTLNGRIYVLGGAEGYCTPALSIMQEYIPETNSWDSIGHMPEELGWQSSTVVNSKVYVSGGANGDCNIYDILSTIYEFVPDPIISSPMLEYEKKEIFVFPNPVDKVINVEIKNAGNTVIEIYSIMGSQVFSKVNYSKTKIIDASSYKAGIYFIKVKQFDRVYKEMVVVK